MNMKKNYIKYFGVRIPPELHCKLRYIAKYEGRSANGQILYLIRKCIREFEESEGKAIPLDDMNKTNKKKPAAK